MAKAMQRSLFKQQLLLLLEEVFRAKIITKPILNGLQETLKDRGLLRDLADGLHGHLQEAQLPFLPYKFVRLAIREIGQVKESSVMIFKDTSDSDSPQPTCLVGHRFTPEIEECFRWNLREFSSHMNIEEDYSGYDYRAVGILSDLLEKVKKADFCLFDNRGTTSPSKPSVYIEAGMAIALKRPFIFCNYKGEDWPVNLSNMVFLPYENYTQLFQSLAIRLPVFLKNHVKPRKEKAARRQL